MQKEGMEIEGLCTDVSDIKKDFEEKLHIIMIFNFMINDNYHDQNLDYQ